MSVEIIAVSQAMSRALDLAARVAETPSASSLLVLGETGTGKDRLARFIHERSRATGALVRIDCAALPETFVESELFGHERGAFTGISRKNLYERLRRMGR